jgi:hypothetical protein
MGNHSRGERAANVQVSNGVTKDECVAMREAPNRTLKIPALMISSIPINIRGGRLRPSEEDGKMYWKLPFNRP